MASVKNNSPAILIEMAPSVHQQEFFGTANSSLPPGFVLTRSGPLVNKTLQIVGAKLGFALHYAKTGCIVADPGGVAVRWISNYQAHTGAIPDEI